MADLITITTLNRLFDAIKLAYNPGPNTVIPLQYRHLEILKEAIEAGGGGSSIFTEDPVDSGNYKYLDGEITFDMLNVTGDVSLAETTAVVFGDPATNGSFRLRMEGTLGAGGILVVEERVSGAWVKKGEFTGNFEIVQVAGTAIDIDRNSNNKMYWCRNAGTVTVNVNTVAEHDVAFAVVNVGGGDIEFNHAPEFLEDIVNATDAANFALRTVGNMVSYFLSGTSLFRYGDIEA